MTYIGENRVKNIPEWRGMIEIPDDRERPYSKESYAAQYGITVEDAREFLEQCETHTQVERMIFALYKSDPELKRRAMLMDEDEREPTDEEKRIANRLLRQLGLDPLYDLDEDEE